MPLQHLRNCCGKERFSELLLLYVGRDIHIDIDEVINIWWTKEFCFSFWLTIYWYVQLALRANTVRPTFKGTAAVLIQYTFCQIQLIVSHGPLAVSWLCKWESKVAWAKSHTLVGWFQAIITLFQKHGREGCHLIGRWAQISATFCKNHGLYFWTYTDNWKLQ